MVGVAVETSTRGDFTGDSTLGWAITLARFAWRPPRDLRRVRFLVEGRSSWVKWVDDSDEDSRSLVVDWTSLESVSSASEEKYLWRGFVVEGELLSILRFFRSDTSGCFCCCCCCCCAISSWRQSRNVSAPLQRSIFSRNRVQTCFNTGDNAWRGLSCVFKAIEPLSLVPVTPNISWHNPSSVFCNRNQSSLSQESTKQW